MTPPPRPRNVIPTPALAILFVALVVGIALQLYQNRTASAGVLDYRSDFATAMEEARDSGKPVFVNFGGPW